MINNSMTDSNKKPESGKDSVPEKKPNELGGIQLSSHFKIYDPNSKEVMVQRRGDI
jgi:hypothetical protein